MIPKELHASGWVEGEFHDVGNQDCVKRFAKTCQNLTDTCEIFKDTWGTVSRLVLDPRVDRRYPRCSFKNIIVRVTCGEGSSASSVESSRGLYI